MTEERGNAAPDENAAKRSYTVTLCAEIEAATPEEALADLLRGLAQGESFNFGVAAEGEEEEVFCNSDIEL